VDHKPFAFDMTLCKEFALYSVNQPGAAFALHDAPTLRRCSGGRQPLVLQLLMIEPRNSLFSRATEHIDVTFGNVPRAFNLHIPPFRMPRPAS